MFGIHYKKAPPTTYVMHFTNGLLQKHGPGLSFWYLNPISTVIDIPLASSDLPFIFQEVTGDFQDVTLQGQLTYRVVDPQRLAEFLDFSVAPDGTYVSEDPDKLGLRLINTAQRSAKNVTQNLTLKEVLARARTLVDEVTEELKQADSIAMLGVEILALSLVSVRPTPEMARALEAEAREKLNLEADQAVYTRRKAALAEERALKESELNTEIAVEQKKRQIRETRAAADLSLEKERTELIKIKTENDRQVAESQGHRLETVLKPIRQTDWRTLMAANGGKSDPRVAISMAFQELAQNAGKIGQVNMTPDLLESLMRAPNGER